MTITAGWVRGVPAARPRRPSGTEKTNPIEPIEVKPWRFKQMSQILRNRAHSHHLPCFQMVTEKFGPISGNCGSSRTRIRREGRSGLLRLLPPRPWRTSAAGEPLSRTKLECPLDSMAKSLWVLSQDPGGPGRNCPAIGPAHSRARVQSSGRAGLKIARTLRWKKAPEGLHAQLTNSCILPSSGKPEGGISASRPSARSWLSSAGRVRRL
jgi:hypothetical protein